MSKPTYGEMRTRAERIRDEAVKTGVLAGIKFLQAHYGDEWVERIDCEALDLSNGSRCILGQLEGEYDDGISMLAPDWADGNEWAASHGFYDYDDSYGHLDEAWHAVLCDKEAIPGGTS